MTLIVHKKGKNRGDGGFVYKNGKKQRDKSVKKKRVDFNRNLISIYFFLFDANAIKCNKYNEIKNSKQ